MACSLNKNSQSRRCFNLASAALGARLAAADKAAAVQRCLARPTRRSKQLEEPELIEAKAHRPAGYWWKHSAESPGPAATSRATRSPNIRPCYEWAGRESSRESVVCSPPMVSGVVDSS